MSISRRNKPEPAASSDAPQWLLDEVAELRRRLEEAEDTLAALRDGEVDAVVVGSNVFVLDGVEASSNRFRGSVLAQITDAVIALDHEHHVTYCNAAAERAYEINASAVLGRLIEDVLGQQQWLESTSEALTTLGKLGIWRGVVERVRDAESRFDELLLSRLRDVAGEPSGLLLIVRDVTERIRLQVEREGLLQTATRARDAAEKARAEAEIANRAKSEFLAVMSHELRTPLNAIGGYAELIELGVHGPVTEAQRSALGRLQMSQRHLLALISGVLDYSRIEAGALIYRPVDVPVVEAVAEAEVLVAPQLRTKGLGYTWSGAVPELTVRADREKLQQVLLNLLGNAIKFTYVRDGVPGRIEVACSVDAGATAGARAAAPPFVRLQVRDTGEGISADQLERVFEPFVQVDQRLTRPHAGVGLGLAISRDLARGMGGDLTVESTRGVGSTFTLTLPQGASSADHAALAASPAQESESLN